MLLESDAGDAGELLVCAVTTTEPDLGTVDALARLTLATRRLGRPLKVCHASPALRELVVFMGLSDVLPCDLGSAGKARR